MEGNNENYIRVKIPLVDELRRTYNSTIISEEAIEKGFMNLKHVPIIYEDSVIGVMTDESGGFLFKQMTPEIIIKEVEEKDGLNVIQNFQLMSVTIK